MKDGEVAIRQAGGELVTPVGERRLSRREALRRAAAFSGALLAVETGHAAARGNLSIATDALATVALPPDVGQTELQVYLRETGHSLGGSMLDYWRANGAASVYGLPISEPFASGDGYYSQAFEHAVFQYRPEFLDTADPIMRLMPIGHLAVRNRPEAFRRDGRRGAGGGDRRDAAWRPLDPNGNSVARVLERGGVFVEATGHTISGDFLAWYDFHEGSFYLGNPLSQPMAEGGMTVQYFEGGLLRRSEAGLSLAPLAAELAAELGIDTSSVEQGDLPVFDEPRLWIADNPNPLGDPYAPGPKWLEVSIAEQRLWAYHGGTLLSTTLVSTGIPPNETERGLFHVRLKFVEQDLSGFTDATGEVLGFGEAPPGTIPYEVKDVPHVMYFNLDAEALHGAYWHNNFGQKMSHGCINLPLDFAAWLYGWAPLGTAVWVHD